jgi:GNAT superfamily N-acetyltransferase
MPPSGLRIDAIPARDLYSFYLKYVEHSQGQQITPISRYRALSQSKNPYAEEGDVGLLVAYFGDRCVGYQGVLPGKLRNSHGTAKVFWCTAAYVLPEFRKRMVAIQLVKKLVSLGKDIVLTGFDKVVADVFKGLHFREIQPLEYLSLRVDRLDLFSYPFRRFYRLKKRWPAFQNVAEAGIRFSRRRFHPAVRTSYYRMLDRRASKFLEGVRWEEARSVRSLSLNGAAAPNHETGFQRDLEAIDWMLEFPWIQDGPPPTRPLYYFSEAYDHFRYIVLTIKGTDGECRAFVVLSLTVEKGESKLKVLDFRGHPEDDKALFWLVCKHAAQHQVDEVELPLRMESQAASLPFASFVTKRESRRYLCYPSSKDSPLARAIPRLSLDLCDGDCAFT